MDGWKNDADEQKRVPTRLLAALFFILLRTRRTITRTRRSVPVRRNVRRHHKGSESGRSCTDNPAVCFSARCMRVCLCSCVCVGVRTDALSLFIVTRERARTRNRALWLWSATPPSSDTTRNNNYNGGAASVWSLYYCDLNLIINGINGH